MKPTKKMQTPPHQKRILLVARKRGFWSTSACEGAFPQRILLPARPHFWQYPFYFILLLWTILRRGPTVVILGTSMPLAHWFAGLRRAGLFPKVRTITDHQFLSEKDIRQFSAVWMYSREESGRYGPEVRSRFEFLSYPPVTGLVRSIETAPGDYVFAGGNHKRDFPSLIAAIKGLPLMVTIVTDRAIDERLPENCTLLKHRPLKEYLSMMGSSRFVTIPLLKSDVPHGHGDIAAALSLGKAVITTRGATVGDYVTDGINGLLVDPGDVAGYRAAILSLWEDAGLRMRLEAGAREKSREFSYEHFAEKLLALCDRVATERS